jgi:hypothetical protein
VLCCAVLCCAVLCSPPLFLSLFLSLSYRAVAHGRRRHRSLHAVRRQPRMRSWGTPQRIRPVHQLAVCGVPCHSCGVHQPSSTIYAEWRARASSEATSTAALPGALYSCLCTARPKLPEGAWVREGGAPACPPTKAFSDATASRSSSLSPHECEPSAEVATHKMPTRTADLLVTYSCPSC